MGGGGWRDDVSSKTTPDHGGCRVHRETPPVKLGLTMGAAMCMGRHP